MKLLLTLLALFFSLVSFGQLTHYFIEEYPQNIFPNGVPFCVNYSHEEQVDFGAIYTTDTTDGEISDTYETNENYEKDSNKLLAKDYVRQHLLPDTKFIYTIDNKNKDTLFALPIDDYLNSDFYAMHTVLKSNKFYAVTYERIFANELRSSEKFLCTFSKSEKFISRILIASFIYSGTGYSYSGARVPWFPHEQGCINKDRTINFLSPNHGDKNYKIQADGQIVEAK